MRRPRRRNLATDELNITSMMDMFTIILVFLLKSFSTEELAVAPSSELTLPMSSTTRPPKLAVNVVVTRDQILVDGVSVLPLTTGPAGVQVPAAEKQGALLPRLQERLQQKADAAKAIATASGRADHEFRGEVLLQCDKSLPFSVVSDVMYTAGQAQFADFRFVVYRRGE